MAYGDFKDLNRRSAADKVLRDRAFNMAKITKYNGYQRGISSNFYKFFDKKTSGGTIKNGNISNKELADKLHKPIIGKFTKGIVHPPFIDTIWGTDLLDIYLISKFNKRFRFLLCIIDIYSKYAKVIPLKNKKDIKITNTFQKMLDESNRKPSKIWVDKGSVFYYRSIKSQLEKNTAEMYSTHNKGISVVLEP